MSQSDSDDGMPALMSGSQLTAERLTSGTIQRQTTQNNAQEQVAVASGGNREQEPSLRDALPPTRPSIQMLESMVETANRMTTGPISELAGSFGDAIRRDGVDSYVPSLPLNLEPLPGFMTIPPYPTFPTAIPPTIQQHRGDLDAHRDHIAAVLNAGLITANSLEAALPTASQSPNAAALPGQPGQTSAYGFSVGRSGNQTNDQNDSRSIRAVGGTTFQSRANSTTLALDNARAWRQRLDSLLSHQRTLNRTEAELGRLVARAGAEEALARIIREADEPDRPASNPPQIDHDNLSQYNYENVYERHDDLEHQYGLLVASAAGIDRSKLEEKMKKDEASLKAINHLHYLTMLKNADDNKPDALKLSQELGLNSIHDSLLNEQVHDLPMLIEELPVPQLSSWLEPGMGWDGKQSGGRNRSHISTRSESTGIATGRLFNPPAPPPPLDATIEDRDNALLRERLEIRQMRETRLRERELRARFRGVIEAESRPGVFSSIMTMKREWPVKVTIHSVDWKNMSLIGTMTAINIPDGRRHSSDEQNNEKEEAIKGNSMESLFIGEIIDFRIHELETVDTNKDYTVGGAKVDVRYWAGVGPFKEAILREKEIRAAKKLSDESSGLSSPKPDRSNSSGVKPSTLDLYGEDEDELIDATMTKCLGSAKWIRENMSQWILMRWKEQCFLPKSSSPTNDGSHPELQFFHEEDGSRHTMLRNDTYGLTISGYYYVALHRQSGRIEGLYYDPRSQPFQRLSMDPKDCVRGRGGLRRDFGVFELR